LFYIILIYYDIKVFITIDSLYCLKEFTAINYI